MHVCVMNIVLFCFDCNGISITFSQRIRYTVKFEHTSSINEIHDSIPIRTVAACMCFRLFDVRSKLDAFFVHKIRIVAGFVHMFWQNARS